jgi:hypothetical protein
MKTTFAWVCALLTIPLTYILVQLAWFIIKGTESSFLLSWGMTHGGILFVVLLPICFAISAFVMFWLYRAWHSD